MLTLPLPSVPAATKRTALLSLACVLPAPQHGLISQAITVTIVAMHCLYTLWQFINNGFSVRSWYVSQSLWRILATCGWLFSLHDILLKLLGISNVGFVVAKKTIPKTTPISGYVPIQRQDEYGLSSQ
ncbi:hypothetical protein YC2023_098773 [Brassica napus]